MLLQIGVSVEELIVEILAARPQASAAGLHALIAAKGRKCSLQAVYKALSHLERGGVVIKASGSYSLRLPWLMDFLSLAKTIEANHFDPAKENQALPAPGQKRSWHFTSLLRMDDFWAHLVLRLFQQSSDNLMFEYLPHPWFEFVNRAKENQFRRAVLRRAGKLYIIVGGDTFLDRECTRGWTSDLYCFSSAESKFHSLRNRYLDVIGSFILTVKISPAIARQLDRYFEQVKDRADFALPGISRILTQSTHSEITLENDPASAVRLKQIFKNYFGLKAAPKRAAP